MSRPPRNHVWGHEIPFICPASPITPLRNQVPSLIRSLSRQRTSNERLFGFIFLYRLTAGLWYPATGASINTWVTVTRVYLGVADVRFRALTNLLRNVTTCCMEGSVSNHLPPCSFLVISSTLRPRTFSSCSASISLQVAEKMWEEMPLSRSPSVRR